jgi:hypothetical protein
MTDNETINQTIRDVLAKCSGAKRPLDCLAEEIGKLVLERKWTENDAKLVSQTVLRMLTVLLQPPDEGQSAKHSEALADEDGA